MRDLHKILAKLGTDYLDLWQVHDVRTMREFAETGRDGEALPAFIETRESGLVSYISGSVRVVLLRRL